jgi:hypothetical protein
MQNLPPQQNDTRRDPLQQPDDKAPVQPTVGVYDRPDNVKSGGMNMMTILLIVIALVIVGAIVWTVVM